MRDKDLSHGALQSLKVIYTICLFFFLVIMLLDVYSGRPAFQMITSDLHLTESGTNRF